MLVMLSNTDIIVSFYCFRNSLLLSVFFFKIDHCGLHSRTALFYAMQSGNFKVAKILLDHGAAPSLRGLGPDGRYSGT